MCSGSTRYSAASGFAPPEVVEPALREAAHRPLGGLPDRLELPEPHQAVAAELVRLDRPALAAGAQGADVEGEADDVQRRGVGANALDDRPAAMEAVQLACCRAELDDPLRRATGAERPQGPAHLRGRAPRAVACTSAWMSRRDGHAAQELEAADDHGDQPKAPFGGAAGERIDVGHERTVLAAPSGEHDHRGDHGPGSAPNGGSMPSLPDIGAAR